MASGCPLDRVRPWQVVAGLVFGMTVALVEVASFASMERTRALLLTSLFAPIGFAGMAFVVGLQVVNPACSHRVFQWMCTAFFIFPAASGLLALVSYPARLHATTSTSIHTTPFALAAAAASFVLWKRYAARKL